MKKKTTRKQIKHTWRPTKKKRDYETEQQPQHCSHTPSLQLVVAAASAVVVVAQPLQHTHCLNNSFQQRHTHYWQAAVLLEGAVGAVAGEVEVPLQVHRVE